MRERVKLNESSGKTKGVSITTDGTKVTLITNRQISNENIKVVRSILDDSIAWADNSTKEVIIWFDLNVSSSKDKYDTVINSLT